MGVEGTALDMSPAADEPTRGRCQSTGLLQANGLPGYDRRSRQDNIGPNCGADAATTKQGKAVLSLAHGFKGYLYKQLDPTAWGRRGLSPTNRLVAALIVLAVVVGILETEAGIRASAPAAFLWTEWILTAAFVTEYIARVYSAGVDPAFSGFRGRLRYVTRFWSIVDLLAILPFLLTLGGHNSFVLRLFRFFRLLRLARLGRYSDAWDVLSAALRSRKHELIISLGIAGLLLILSSALLYLVEADEQPEAFGSIPRALWWSIATLTTVGYGDAAPVTALGRVFAGFTAVAGIGLIAMPTGILASAFSDAMQKRRDLAKDDSPRGAKD